MDKKWLCIVVALAVILAGLGALFWYLFYPRDHTIQPAQPVIHVNSTAEIEQLLDSVDTIIFDCDGVLYIGNTVLQGRHQQSSCVCEKALHCRLARVRGVREVARKESAVRN